MVHALADARRLLKPAGLLVDIHPLAVPPVLAVHREGRCVFSEVCPSQGAEAYRQADRALDEAIQRQEFAPEQGTVFDFLTHAPSVTALDDHLTATSAFDQEPGDPEAEMLWAELFKRADGAAGARTSDVEVILLEKARMTTLRPLPW